jgi:hypothetical protein
MAVSMSLNSVGSPIGSAVAGPLIGAGLLVALAVAAGFAFAASAVTVLLIPGADRAAGPPEMPLPVEVPRPAPEAELAELRSAR